MRRKEERRDMKERVWGESERKKKGGENGRRCLDERKKENGEGERGLVTTVSRPAQRRARRSLVYCLNFVFLFVMLYFFLCHF